MNIQALVSSYCEESGENMSPDKAGGFDLIIDNDYHIQIIPDQHNWALFIGTLTSKRLSEQNFYAPILESLLKRNVACWRNRNDFLFFDSKTEELKLAYRLYLKKQNKLSFTVELNRYVERLKEWMICIEDTGSTPTPQSVPGTLTPGLRGLIRE